MRYLERQAKVEGDVYACIDEIAEEIGLDVPFYPEVYWVGKRLSFKQLKLSPCYQHMFQEVKKNKTGIFFTPSRMILIGKDDKSTKAEEATHFIHYINARINSEGRTNLDFLAIRIIEEMLGYFGSKLIIPERKSDYDNIKDLLPIYKGKIHEEDLSNVLKKIDHEELLYSQGYNLGEILFTKYINKEIQLSYIRKLFSDNMQKPKEPLSKLIELKRRLLN